MERAHSTHSKFWLEDLTGRDQPEDLGRDGKITL